MTETRTEAERAPKGSADGLDRRDFLKSVGFAVGASLAAGCRRPPAEEAVPFLEQPEETVPGKAVWYASACSACPAGCGTLVKTRDGRPIKLEGNPDHPLSRGGLCALGQASVLGLYDTLRLRAPLRGPFRGRVRDAEKTDWPTADAEIAGRLRQIAERGGRVRLLTGTVTGPAERAAIEGFLGRLADAGADAAHVAYDALSSSAIREAHERTHGAAVLPRYRFDRAEVIVSFDADFLGTWISPVEHTAGYRERRVPGSSGEEAGHGAEPALSRHVQIESRMSLTGTNADRRIPVAPGDLGPAMSHLAARVAERAGVDLGLDVPDEPPPVDEGLLESLTDDLWRARGRALVVSGSQDPDVHVLVNAVNHLLGAEGSTLDLERPSNQRRGDDRKLAALLAELRRGEVDALLIREVDPVAELPDGAALAEALEATELTVALAGHRTETAAACRWVCPEPHFLEAWRDAEPVAGIAVLAQPTLRPLGDTRPMLESLPAWSGATSASGGRAPSAYRQIRDHWRTHVFPRRKSKKPYPSGDFQAFWDRAVHDGVAELTVDAAPAARALRFRAERVGPIRRRQTAAPGRFELVLHPEIGILDGRGAENPWLQELPDPVTKATWGNVASLSPRAARDLSIEQGDVVRLALEGVRETLELPALIQPGQDDRTVAVALGHGRAGTARFAGVGPRWIEKRPTTAEGEPVGVNLSPWLEVTAGALRYERRGLTVHATGRRRPPATTQRYDRLEVPEELAGRLGSTETRRTVARETTLAALLHEAEHDGRETHGEGHPTLWAEHRYDGHHWGLMIDLSACTGCSACVVSCQAENNVPVVGRDEVLRQREMHWLRIDRYYTGEGDEIAALHQPMLCQHCDNAPCETVCPVLATVHSSEGLNQQVYNRCVGTRYCANNCPYKVRRFNWFDYPREDRLQNLVLNPDVVVRTRGVMEKCSLCVQRIQEQKLAAKSAGRPLADGAIETACEQSCPARAITFGDLSDPESRVSKRAADRRAYRALDELNVRPSVGYLAKVRNPETPQDRNPDQEDHRA